MNATAKTSVFWVFIFICLMVLWAVIQKNANAGKHAELSYSELFERVQSGQILEATIQGDQLYGHLKNSPKDLFHTTIPTDHVDLEKALLASKAYFSIKEPQSNVLMAPLFNVAQFVLLCAILCFMLRRMRSDDKMACLVWDAVYTLQKAGLESDAARLRRSLV